MLQMLSKELDKLCEENLPAPLVGAGRAIGALGFKLCISAKTSYCTHIGVRLGGPFFSARVATSCRPCHGDGG